MIRWSTIISKYNGTTTLIKSTCYTVTIYILYNVTGNESSNDNRRARFEAHHSWVRDCYYITSSSVKWMSHISKLSIREKAFVNNYVYPITATLYFYKNTIHYNIKSVQSRNNITTKRWWWWRRRRLISQQNARD